MSDSVNSVTAGEAQTMNNERQTKNTMMENKPTSIRREELKRNLDIGGALAMKLIRIQRGSVEAVAHADIETLTKAYGVGAKTAQKLKGKAQGRLQSEDWEPERLDTPADTTVGKMATNRNRTHGGNVLVVWGDGQMPETERQARVDLDCALADANLEPDMVGRMAGSDEAHVVSSYVKFQCQLNGQSIGQRAFEVDEPASSWGEPDSSAWAREYEKRDKRACAWADHLVIVAQGKFSGCLVSRNLELDEPAEVHVYIQNDFEWEDEDGETVETVTIDDEERTANGDISDAVEMQEADRQAFEDMVDTMEDNDEFTDGHGGESQPHPAWDELQ